VDADETLARKSTKLVEKLIIFGQWHPLKPFSFKTTSKPTRVPRKRSSVCVSYMVCKAIIALPHLLSYLKPRLSRRLKEKSFLE
jgi:hypothetical protein